MKTPSYRGRDFTFGKAILNLRNSIGLTQAGLADYLGVSRHAVNFWEAGSTYPKAENLKELIALGVKHQAFATGREAEEIRSLWKAAHQKGWLSETWLAALLAQTAPPPSALPSQDAVSRSMPSGKVGPKVDWGEAIAVPTFYGREWELKLLSEWVVVNRCQVVSILGMGGIGKSALAVSLMHQLASNFEVVIWRSLRDAPTIEILLDDCLQLLAPQLLEKVSTSLDRRLSLLLEHLRQQRVLVVLDNLESLLGEGENNSQLRPGYEDYTRLLKRLASTEHQSCLLLTSREKPADLIEFESNRSLVRVLHLARLANQACENLLAEKDVAGTRAELGRLIEAYGGNPLALKIVAQTILDLFNGQVAPFLEQGEVIFGGVRGLLKEQFARLTTLELQVVLWLAILREPSTLAELLRLLARPVPRARLLEALEALHRRSLIERGKKPGSFTLQAVVLEYATAQLIGEATTEIEEGGLTRLIEHGLELARSRDFVRQTQARVIVTPILAQLGQRYPRQNGLEEQLLTRLSQLKILDNDSQGYAPANLTLLLGRLRGHLHKTDLSGMTLREAYLQGVELRDANLAGAFVQDCVFTETFDILLMVDVSSTGEYWAAASRRGEVLVWFVGDMTLYRTWRAHTDMVWNLKFSPDGHLLATGSWDGTVKLWEIASGTLLWWGRHTSYVNSLAFSPDGRWLASAGNDSVVRVWDLTSGVELQTLPHPGPVTGSGISWSADGHLLATGGLDGYIRLWDMPSSGPARCIREIQAHPQSVDGLTFSPAGDRLASTSDEGSVKLWETASGQLTQTLNGHTDRMGRLAWSRDGRVLASAGRDKTILLWDVEQGHYRAALQGHKGGITGLAFTPDGQTLLSTGESTVRVWEVASGQAQQVIQGYADFFYVLAWSPDGTTLVSGSMNWLVDIWDVTGAKAPQVLPGHAGSVCGVGWSPDNRYLATTEWENELRIWDPASGNCLEILHNPEDPTTLFYDLAWSPAGDRFVIGTNRYGIRIFELAAPHRPWRAPDFPAWIRHVAWNPNGGQIVGGGDDGTVYVWNAANETLVKELKGHHSRVTSLAWSPDGTRLASGGSSLTSGEVFVWDMQGGELVRTIEDPSGMVFALAWGSDGNMVISGGGDGQLRWWDIQSGHCVRVCKAHDGTIQALKRSPDGTKLASCGDDGAIKVWDLASGAYWQTLRHDRPYERLNITGIRGLTEVQKASLLTLGAFEDDNS